MIGESLDTDRIAIIGPGRLGTAFAYKFSRDGKRVAIYYKDADFCETLNRERVNPSHLTEDMARRLGGSDRVPRFSSTVYATNDLERVIDENDFIFLSVTMDRLGEILDQIEPILQNKLTSTCFISGIKGLTAIETTCQLITPSQLIRNRFRNMGEKVSLVSIGGPFFDMDVALGNPVCLSVAGKRRICQTVQSEFLSANRRELTAFYNFDAVGIEARLSWSWRFHPRNPFLAIRGGNTRPFPNTRRKFSGLPKPGRGWRHVRHPCLGRE